MPASRSLLADAAARLAAAGVSSPTVDAALLMAHVTGRPRTMVGLLGEIDAGMAEKFRALVARRASREPLQHLTGSAPFRHLELAVGPGVFVPRPETELLVDAALSQLRGHSSPLIVDLCTGSAAIALSIALEHRGAEVHAVELAPDALRWARRNIEDHADRVGSAGSSLTLHPGDATSASEHVLAPLCGRVDVVLTNPPYVPEGATPREPEVRDHDPALALYGGPDGLALIRPLAGQAARLLRPGGLLLVEHADEQGESARELGVPALLRGMVETHGPPLPSSAQVWAEVADQCDLAGRPRFTRALRAAVVGER